jgi:hypothetical protein
MEILGLQVAGSLLCIGSKDSRIRIDAEGKNEFGLFLAFESPL